VEAYDAFLKGVVHWYRSTADDSRKAIQYFNKAIELDPNYSHAYGALGLLYWLAHPEWLDIDWPQSRLMARQYLGLAMKNPHPYAHDLAAYMNLNSRLHKEAISEVERAFAISPNCPGTRGVMASVLNFAGRPKEAIGHANFVMKYDPRLSFLALFHLGIAHFSMGKYEQAATYFERSLTHKPEFRLPLVPLAASYAHFGRIQDARETLKSYLKENPKASQLGVLMQSWPFKDLEVADRFAEGVFKAGIKGQPSGYYKILKENRLGGDRIRDLYFSRTITGFRIDTGDQWWIEYSKDGKKNKRWGKVAGKDISDIGKAWLEGDLACEQWDKLLDGLKSCYHIYRNPEGTPEEYNEFLAMTDFAIIPFSPID
jgi:tetratricopeptide (TPR) repeat protein